MTSIFAKPMSNGMFGQVPIENMLSNEYDLDSSSSCSSYDSHQHEADGASDSSDPSDIVFEGSVEAEFDVERFGSSQLQSR